MLNVDIVELEKHMENLKGILKDSLLSSAIWDKEVGLDLVSHNPLEEATAMFNVLTGQISDTLVASNFKPLNGYYILDLADDRMMIVLRHGDDMMQGMLLDKSKLNIGVLFSVAIPRALAEVEQARGV